MNTEESKGVLKWGRYVLMVLAVFLAVQTVGALKNLGNINPAYNSMSFTGEGEVVSVPDVANFSFSVSADAKTVTDAQAKVTEKIDAILAELKAQGVDDKDIKTTNYSVWPKYTYSQTVCSPTYCPPSRQIPDGYTASHDVSVKVRKTEDAGKLLGVVGDKGATNISGISFGVDDPDALVEQARAEAIADARAKAKKLSKELGVKLVRVVSFYDNTPGGPIPYYAEGMGGDMIKSAIASAPTIPTGENKTKVTVTVTYEIR